MTSWIDEFPARIAALDDAHLRRQRRAVVPAEGAHLRVDGAPMLAFCSNDYLGLAAHPALAEAACAGTREFGVGSGGSPLVSGHSLANAALEDDLARFVQLPRALYFYAGYATNIGIVPALVGAGDALFSDALNHACLIDGARLAGCELKRYPHADVEAAMRQLMARRDGAAMLATDGVFSMDGDAAPLADLALVARTQDALLYVDDAHGIGVLGPEGRGSLAVAGLGAREVPLLLVPLGKAFGGQGAVLMGSDALIGHVAETARPYLFSTAPAPAMAAAMRASLRLIRKESWRRAKLASVVMRFRRGASALGLPLQESFTPIQPIVLGDNASALAAARALEERGYLVTAIRPPTVPEGQARLRVTLSVDHGEADVDGLLAALSEAVKPAADPVPA